MDYFEDVWYHGDIEKEDPFMMLLAASSEKEMDKISRGDKIMEEINDKVKVLNLDPEIAKEFAVFNDEELIKNTLLEKGEIKGLVKAAKNMIKDKVDINIISKYTGLSEQEILALK